MQYLTLLTTLLAAAASAAPTTVKRQQYYGISLSFHQEVNGEVIAEPAPVEINTLTRIYDATAFEIVFDGSYSGLTEAQFNAVECRAYKDAEGLVPGSATFSAKNPAELATPNNPVEINAVLCYVTEGSE
ncbi:MAG: hypothetical protein M1820_003091 [Bogoriella megaspora]|nr:MAG: hypothetical protein M1820_003091 [Bogoriella megaspora]